MAPASLWLNMYSCCMCSSMNLAGWQGRMLHLLMTHTVDSAATRLNKEGHISSSTLVSATHRSLKRNESFMTSETPPWSDERAENLTCASRGKTPLDVSQYSSCCRTGCTDVQRSCKALNYTTSAESIGISQTLAAVWTLSTAKWSHL